MKLKKLLGKKVTYKPDTIACKRKNKNTFVVHHYCPHTYNAGDHFVILSIRKHLKQYLPNVLFVPKPVAGNRGWGKPIGLKGENILFSNQYADAVILGGSDQYNNWSPKIEAKEINELIPPLFFIGLGVSSKDLNDKPNITDDKYYADILAANNKTRLSSVRDDITKNFLSDLGFNDAFNTGCPALYLFDNKLEINDSKDVMLTFPYPLIHKKSNQKYQILNNFIEEIIQYVKDKNLNPVIVCHDDRDVPMAQEIFKQHDIFFSNYTHDYFDLYKSAKMVIGSRLHATIFNSGIGTPSININLDLRGVGYSNSFGLAEWNLNYNNPNLVKEAKLRIDTLVNNDLSAFDNFIELRKERKAIFNKFMKDTAEIIRRG
jgi:hypothetical protein